MIFGGLWDAPICDDAIEVPAPVGLACLYCKEAIAKDDQGFMMLVMRAARESSLEPEHRNCHLRDVIGSVGHLRKQCSCYGGTEGDPEGMTKREAAEAAVKLYLIGNSS